MKRMIVVSSVLMILGAANALADAKHSHGKKATKPVTMTGEVIDLYCYMQHPESAVGADHAKCAKTCINKGLPIGFLADDGTVYTIIGRDHEPVTAMVVDLAGTKSTITGTVIEHHGVKAIELVSAGAVGPRAKPSAQAAAMYTCSMHPDVRQAQPGKCSKCGMTLELEKKK